MPFFENKFAVKKTPPRKSQTTSSIHQNLDPVTDQKEFGLNYDMAKLQLGNQKNVFKDGKWIPSNALDENSDNSVKKELEQLVKENQNLIEENNMLKVKVEILLHMLAETTAESQLQETEIHQLKEKLASIQHDTRQ